MAPKLIRAEYDDDYLIKVEFDNGLEGILDLQGELWGEVFEPLKELSNFRFFVLDKVLQTIVWPATGADLAPEFVYQQAAP